jgi:hypothetical protein
MLEAMFSPKVRKARKTKPGHEPVPAPLSVRREGDKPVLVEEPRRITLVNDEPVSRRLRAPSDPPPPLRVAPSTPPPPLATPAEPSEPSAADDMPDDVDSDLTRGNG